MIQRWRYRARQAWLDWREGYSPVEALRRWL